MSERTPDWSEFDLGGEHFRYYSWPPSERLSDKDK